VDIWVRSDIERMTCRVSGVNRLGMREQTIHLLKWCTAMKDTKTRRQLRPEERAALTDELSLPPTNFGFVEDAWSGRLLSRYLRISRGMEVGARQCRRLLNDLALPRRHPATPRCVDPQIPSAVPWEDAELLSSRRPPLPSALRKESVLGQVRRLASSGLPLYPFIQTLFDLISEAIPTGDLPKGLWTDARVSSSWVFANLDVGKWFPVLANSGDLGQSEAWPGLRPRRELNRTNPVLTLGEFTAPDYRRSLIYNEFFRPLKLEQGLLLQLTDHNDLVGYYPIYRSATMRPFGHDEIAFLAKAAPHIAHGIKVAKLIDAQILTDTASMPVACEPGVVVMDSTGRPIALNAQARSLFFQAGLCDGITMTPYTEAHWRRLLEYIARSLRAIFQQNMNSNGDIGAPAAQIVSFRAGITLRALPQLTYAHCPELSLEAVNHEAKVW
jgi:hypothetical protein